MHSNLIILHQTIHSCASFQLSLICCSRSSRGGRNRGGLTLEDFPSINAGADNSLVTLEDIEGSSSSDEDEDDTVDQSVGESVKKYLPKPLLGRKSVFISGNLKRGGKKLSPKKKLGKSRKNLNPMMDRISREGEEKAGEGVKDKVEEAMKEKVEPRRSSGRAATKAAGQSLSPAVLQVGQVTIGCLLKLTVCVLAPINHAGGIGNLC